MTNQRTRAVEALAKGLHNAAWPQCARWPECSHRMVLSDWQAVAREALEYGASVAGRALGEKP